MSPNIVTLGGFKYEVQPKNFWTQRELEQKLTALYEASLPKGATFSPKELQRFMLHHMNNETRAFLEIAFDVVFKPVDGGPEISKFLATSILNNEELQTIQKATESFSASSSVSGELPAESPKPSKPKRPSKQKKV